MNNTDIYYKVFRSLAVVEAVGAPSLWLLLHTVPYVSIVIFIISVVGILTIKAGPKALAHKNDTKAKELARRAWEAGKHNQPILLPGAPEWGPEPTVYDCPVYDQSCLDRRMFDAGVITVDEISTCEDADCPNCAPEYKRRRDAMAAKRREENRRFAMLSDAWKFNLMSTAERNRSLEYYDDSHMSQCRQCKDLTFTTDICPTHLLECLKKKDADIENKRQAQIEQARIAKEAEEERRRLVKFSGVTVRRPDPVPEGAVPTFMDNVGTDISHIVWKWYDVDGQQKAYMQPVVADAYEVRDGSGAVANKWTAIYDPITNAHLGDYRLVNGRSQIRNSQKMTYVQKRPNGHWDKR